MEIISPPLIKSRISELIKTAREDLYIISYTFGITNTELLSFIDCIENNVKVHLVSGKPIDSKALEKIAKLYNISVHLLPSLHSKIYASEFDAIVTSCNFGRLTIPNLIECAVYFEKREHQKEFNALRNQIQEIMERALVVMPMLPYKPANAFDLYEIFFEK